MNKILITGVGGYIGSVAVDMFLQKGYTVIGIDNFMRGFRAPLQYLQKKYGEETFHFYEADLRGGIDQILQKESNISVVIHYAALCNVGESEKEPSLYFNNNIQAVVGLLESMRTAQIRKILFSSTCAVYGEPQQELIAEDHPLSPTHPYGESKFMSERIINWYHKLFGFQYVFLRYFNVCGATDDGEIGDSKNPSFHLMQNATRGVLGIDEFYLNNTIVDTPDKTPIRDYVNVVDLNRAHIAAVEWITNSDQSDVFNLGTGTGNSVLEIIQTVEKVTGKQVKKKEAERRVGDVTRAVASNEKITQVLGWKPTHSLEDSVKSLVAWYTKHPKGWES